ncbi:PfkB family carbohydrate kinase [Natrinema sp. 1APR25-10V2]|uniref:PfkB family carbohydrate kinase n=1 Tax=Natrinema sp. 1APR25-10V2 TaxID=2951081 RepID=UPI00287605B2|nr:PfkB family carbohydrate kinase [Natrinema sp. 1APR25-10V2]MDS0473681.1 PfkB family carbohydrate kinase [Natrinema sp. 1APR25-10V2]
MSYGDLHDRLDDFETDARRVVALPDGSVDHRYALSGAGGRRVRTADDFARQLTRGSRAFALEPLGVEPGGQAVNASVQAHALGDETLLVGHLDHPVLADLPFETRSMGSPAEIRVVSLVENDLLLSEPGPTDDWLLEELLAVVDWERVVGADGLCCANWVSVRGLTAVIDRLAAAPPDDRLAVVVDPGPIDAVEPAALGGLFEALSRVAGADAPLEVVLSVNPRELAAAAAAVDGTKAESGDDSSPDGERTRERAATLRSALDIAGVVSHGSDAAVGATRGDTVAVEMLDVTTIERTTGAGDRFSAGLACALARDWPLETALALGNACAAHFVETGETADPAALRSRLED